jgi:hypothetical protein
MTLFIISLLIVLQSAIVVLAQQENQCPGRFNGQPCVNSDGKSGACIGQYPPCAMGFPCNPYYVCSLDQKPLTNDCSSVQAPCLIGDIKASSPGICKQTLGSTEITCVPRGEETTTPSTGRTRWPTTVGWTETTGTGVTDQERFTACANLPESAVCKLRGNPGICLYSPPPMQKTRKRLRIALRCFETATTTTTNTNAETKSTNSNANSLCKGLKEGDKCDDNGRCVTQGNNELKCVVDRDADPTDPNASSVLMASLSIVVSMLLVFVF